jgi:type I restriction enzyme S subunit
MNFLPLSTVVRFINGDRGKNYPSDDEQMIAGYCLFLSTKNVRKGEFDFSDCRFISEEKHMLLGGGTLEAGDIVLTIRGTIGNTAIYDERCKYRVVRINSAMIIVRPSPQYEAQFVQWFLRSPTFQQWTDNSRRGTAQPHLRAEDLENAAIPLCSGGQQRRIVAKLDALDASAKRARADLDRIPTLVARAKQAILEKEFAGIAAAPKCLRELTSKIGSGSTPHGGRDVYKDEGTPFIRSQNVRFEGFQSDGLAYIDDDAAHVLRGVETKFGDVLFNITGASIGRVCLLPEAMEGARVSQHVAIIRPTQEISPEFLALFLQTPHIQSWIFNANYGVTRQALTKAMIEGISAPAPALPMQERIVRRIEAAFAKIDRIAAEAASARALLDRLDQAILAKAFRGELVPQDPNDEPAEKLLEKIKAARAAPPTRKTRKKQS